MALPLALRQGYASAYTISGCSDPADCGVFSPVPAHCTNNRRGRCPGGVNANGNTDSSLCDGAPIYQRADGTHVLYRGNLTSSSYIYTVWYVADSTALDDCWGSTYQYPYLDSDQKSGRLGSAPTAPGYSAGGGWYDWKNGLAGGINVTAGGGH